MSLLLVVLFILIPKTLYATAALLGGVVYGFIMYSMLDIMLRRA